MQMNSKQLSVTLLMVSLPCLCLGQIQKTFTSPQAAADSLITDAESDNIADLNALLGSAAAQVLTSGDSKGDKEERAEFARLARAKHQLDPDPMNRSRVILSVGQDDWPFPVPIVLIPGSGRWRFDPSLSASEMRARRIGANELDAMEISSGYVEAQQEYATADREKDGVLKYARKVRSSAGKNDGLYSDNNPSSLVPPGFAEATADFETPTRPLKPYHGYYFRILTAQGPDAPGGRHNYLVKGSLIGGFGLIAWPAEYGVTGVHTFIVNQDGIIYQKNLGKLASPVTSFNPDSSWQLVD
jgi:hypothetical protein